MTPRVLQALATLTNDEGLKVNGQGALGTIGVSRALGIWHWPPSRPLGGILLPFCLILTFSFICLSLQRLHSVHAGCRILSITVIIGMIGQREASGAVCDRSIQPETSQTQPKPETEAKHGLAWSIEQDTGSPFVTKSVQPPLDLALRTVP